MSKIFSGGPLDRAVANWDPRRALLHLTGRMLFDSPPTRPQLEETTIDREPDLWRGYAERLFRWRVDETPTKGVRSSRRAGSVIVETRCQKDLSSRAGFVAFLIEEIMADPGETLQLERMSRVERWKATGPLGEKIVKALWSCIDEPDGDKIPVHPRLVDSIRDALRFDESLVEE